MEPYCKGIAKIKHASTGKIYKIECEELDWCSESSEEREMGPEIHYEAIIEHPELGKLSWSLWEYPTGVESSRETQAGAHQVIVDFEYGLGRGEPDL